MDDILIRGATVIDGTGSAPRPLDVALRDGRISAVEQRRTESATREIDATGRVLSPGFIDIHTHSDFTLPLNPLAEASIRAGCHNRGCWQLRLLGGPRLEAENQVADFG
jgi:N-acyl-D-amino-acid deacylase